MEDKYWELPEILKHADMVTRDFGGMNEEELIARIKQFTVRHVLPFKENVPFSIHIVMDIVANMLMEELAVVDQEECDMRIFETYVQGLVSGVIEMMTVKRWVRSEVDWEKEIKEAGGKENA